MASERSSDATPGDVTLEMTSLAPEPCETETSVPAEHSDEPVSNYDGNGQPHVGNVLRDGVRRRMKNKFHRPMRLSIAAQFTTSHKERVARGAAPRETVIPQHRTAASKAVHTTSASCRRCVRIFCGVTPAPKPCGKCSYQLLWIMSGLFIALLKYVFAITCALIIHDGHDVFEDTIGLGVNVQLMCMVVSQLLIAPFTAVGVTIAGPDVIAAIFVGAMAEIIEEETVSDPGQAVPTLLVCMVLTSLLCGITWLLIGYFDGTRIVDYVPVAVVYGFLGCLAYKVLYYCIKVSVGHEWYNPGEWHFWKLLLPVIPLGLGLYYFKKYHHQLHCSPIVFLALFLIVPPMVVYFCMWGTGLDLQTMRDEGWLFGFGHGETLHPMEGSFFWSQWERMIWGPTYTLYNDSHSDNYTELDTHAAVRGGDTSVSDDNSTHDEPAFVEGAPAFTSINGNAVALCIPSMLTTVIVATIALLISVQATKQRMNLPLVSAAKELRINGWANIGCALFVAAPGYTQIKFNLLNWHIIENKTDKKPGLFAVAFALIFMVGGGHVDGFLLVNYLPRLVPGLLLLYAAMPLVENNLILAYKKITKKEFAAVWLIVIVNAVSGVYTHYAFLIAILTGLVLSTLVFAFEYGRNPVIQSIEAGNEVDSDIIRPTEQRLMRRVGIRIRVMRLRGFLFFGSTNQVLISLKKIIDENTSTPFPQRVRYLIFDFTGVQNVDHSSSMTFHDAQQMAAVSRIKLVFTGLNERIEAKFRSHGVLVDPTDEEQLRMKAARTVTTSRGLMVLGGSLVITVLPTLKEGIQHVEEEILHRVELVREQWLVFESFQKAHSEARIKTEQLVRMACDTFQKICGSARCLDLWRYAAVRTVEAGQTLFQEGARNSTVYILQSGTMLAFVTKDAGCNDGNGRPLKVRVRKQLGSCAFLNESCLYNSDRAEYTAVATSKCILWAFTRPNMERMQDENPRLAMDILRKALRHSVTDNALERTQNVKRQLSQNLALLDSAVDEATTDDGPKHILRQRSVQDDFAIKHELDNSAATSSWSVDAVEADKAWESLNRRLGPVCKLEEGDDIDEPHIDREGTTGIVDWASANHHAHAFEHLTINEEPSSRLRARARSHSFEEVEELEPRLSKQMEERARKCFYKHAAHIHLMVNKANGNVIRTSALEQLSLDTAAKLTQEADPILNDQRLPEINRDSPPDPANKESKVKAKMRRHFKLIRNSVKLLRQKSEDKYLDLKELEQAVLDLGIYPSTQEIEEMHNALSQDARHFADEEEFLAMVRALKLADLTQSAQRRLHRLYTQFACAETGLLTRSGLSQILNTLGHHSEQAELETLMLEWDESGDGQLDYQTLISIISAIMKEEEVQVQIENDFRRFHPDRSAAESEMKSAMENTATIKNERQLYKERHEAAVDLLNYHITTEDVLRVFTKLGVELQREIAEEMLFDADLHGTGVNYYALITCIETLTTSEIHKAMARANEDLASDGVELDEDALAAVLDGAEFE